MGINDLYFSQTANELITCSSDRTAKIWRVNFEEKKLEEVRTLELSEADSVQVKDNVDKQQLAVVLSNTQALTVGFNSDINVWEGEATAPVKTIRGHNAIVNQVINFNNKFVVSGDSSGRVLFWNPENGEAKRPVSQYQGKATVRALAVNSSSVYAAFDDQTAAQFRLND